MATQTEPATDALYQALSSPNPDPQVVHAAIEEIRYLSGHNVIAAIEAKIDSQSARIDVQLTEFRADMDTRLTRLETATEAGFTAVNARIDTLGSRIDAQSSRIDTLEKVVWRVIWPLIVLLAVPIFGLLYRVLTTAPG